MTVDENFLAAMYGHDDDEEPAAKIAEPGSTAIPDRGIISLPALSQIVRQQAQMLATLGRAFSESERKVQRLESRLRAVERHSHSMGRVVNGLDREMDNKLDRREW